MHRAKRSSLMLLSCFLPGVRLFSLMFVSFPRNSTLCVSLAVPNSQPFHGFPSTCAAVVFSVGPQGAHAFISSLPLVWQTFSPPAS